MKFKSIPLHEIKTYENNPREHPVRQLEAIVNSIRRFGFRGSILLDKNNVIIAGHARYEAAAAAGLAEIPCEYADDLTDEEINAYRILDNKIAGMSYDDVDKLYAELQKLPDFDFSTFNVEFNASNVPDFKEHDETAANDVKMIECPSCGHEFAK